ncbi:DUF2235 domain-containing protein [Methylosinus sp. Sm6]|uniref:T6SS phospholipase effector Tle1-like catalytic domain-containing protein n=1 Tax=Methylosinus sp. Sm6 TaxID=2866948 RepID=UPI001C9921B6|nr:DUF2235 domain-containing protein [Methylosinus sp. Sm6]MBY6241684.1 DUF2235 domain-containing protein [Methylosinus sp. Sm6]
MMRKSIREKKKILLFADGTGNSVTTQESNVWRIYRALDTTAQNQIAYYIPGVGTSEFKPWAMLDGATGIGVPANVLKLYRFLSWNYAPGDDVYLFGFSRGAFTIRVLIDLVYREGLQPNEIDGVAVSSATMRRNAKAAWRSYQKNDDSRLKNVWIWLRRLGRRSNAAPKGDNMTFAFVGLFDTVEAYGVPIEELREAINIFVAPISFGNDRAIAPIARHMRHALALDDERTSFHPIRIDQRGRRGGGGDPEIQEVWFAGVHSNIGGGYADDSVAHTPLVWMLEEAQRLARDHAGAEGLALTPGALDAFRATASSFAPLADSRAGLASLYRYDPRSLAPTPRWDFGPTIVHHSVAERMAEQSCNYAPVVLPAEAVFLAPDRALLARGETRWETLRAEAPSQPPIEAGLLARMQERAEAAVAALLGPAEATLELARDHIWRRRVNYFALVATLLALLSLPATGDLWGNLVHIDTDSLSAGGVAPAGAFELAGRIGDGVLSALKGVAELLLSVTPSYFAPFLRGVFTHPWIGGALAVLLVWLWRRAGALEELIHDLAQRGWVQGAPPPPEARTNALVRMLRKSLLAAFLHRQAQAWAAPALFSVAILGAALAVASRLWFNALVGAGLVCWASPPERLEWLGAGAAASKPGYSAAHPDGFATNNPCWASGMAVERGAAYRLSVEIGPHDDPWLDQTMLTDVEGFDSPGAAFLFAAVFRRWPDAAWHQPVARIGARGAEEWPLLPASRDLPLSPREGKCTGLPRDFAATAEHAAFCSSDPDPSACRALGERLKLGDPLPRAEIAAARAAWETRDFTFSGGVCRSVYPRRTLVSDFVAEATGELFLFVNDVVFFPWGQTPQGFYTDNTGTATITLERRP